MKKLLIIFIIPITIIANQNTVEQLFNVQTVKVQQQSIAKKQINHGYLSVDESNIFEVTAWYDGFVEELYVNKIYTKVQKGDPLVTIYSPTVYKAKTDYLNSLKYKNQTNSHNMIKSAKKKLKLLNVHNKEIESIEQNNTINELTTIYAPKDGWIFLKNINNGSSIKTGQKLFEIVDTTTLWAKVEIYQNQLKEFKKFKNFTIQTDSSSSSYLATNPFIYPYIDKTVATVTLRLNIDNKLENLKPGMYIKLYSSKDAKKSLVIPKTAAILKNGKWYAFLATEFKGIYEPIKIEVEPLNNDYYKILGGLTIDDMVVNNALFMMDSDAQINALY